MSLHPENTQKHPVKSEACTHRPQHILHWPWGKTAAWRPWAGQPPKAVLGTKEETLMFHNWLQHSKFCSCICPACSVGRTRRALGPPPDIANQLGSSSRPGTEMKGKKKKNNTATHYMWETCDFLDCVHDFLTKSDRSYISIFGPCL